MKRIVQAGESPLLNRLCSSGFILLVTLILNLSLAPRAISVPLTKESPSPAIPVGEARDLREKESAEPTQPVSQSPIATQRSNLNKHGINHLVETVVSENSDQVFYLEEAGNTYDALNTLNLRSRQLNNGLATPGFGCDGDIYLDEFGKIESSSMIIDGGFIFLVVVEKTGNKSDILHILKLDQASGARVESFGNKGVLSLDVDKNAYLYLDMIVHDKKLIITVSVKFDSGSLLAVDTDRGVLDARFGQDGRLTFEHSGKQIYFMSQRVHGNDLFLGASFYMRGESTESSLLRSEIRVCKVNLTSGKLSAPFNCMDDNSFAGRESERGYVRSINLTSDGNLLLAVDENASEVLYVKNAVALYLLNTETGKLVAGFGRQGRRQLTQPADRHMVRSVTGVDGRFLVVVEKLSPNNSGEPYSPFQAMKEVLVYSVDEKDGALNSEFGSHLGKSGILSLTGEKLQDIVTRKVVLDEKEKNLLVFINRYEHDHGQDKTRKCKAYVESQFWSNGTAVDFDLNVAFPDGKNYQHFLNKVADRQAAENFVSKKHGHTAISRRVPFICREPQRPKPEGILAYAIDVHTGQREKAFGGDGKVLLQPKSGHSYATENVHINNCSYIYMFNLNYSDDAYRVHSATLILSPDGNRYDAYPEDNSNLNSYPEGSSSNAPSSSTQQCSAATNARENVSFIHSAALYLLVASSLLTILW